MIEVSSLDTYSVDNHQCFAVRNPKECNDFSHLIGKTIKMDGEEINVIGVERLAHAPPWKTGELIGIMI